MPSWVYIDIWKDGGNAFLTKEKLEYFKENYCKKVYSSIFKREVYEIDFEKFIPMPEKIIRRGINDDIVNSINYYCSKHKLSKEDLEQLLTGKEDDTKNPLMDKAREEYIDAGRPDIKLTIPNWFDWSTRNWGTKWNACDTQLVNNRITFNTANNRPKVKLMNKILKVIRDLMIESFPDIPIEQQELQIEIEYEEESDVLYYFTFDESEKMTFIDKVIENPEDNEVE